MNILVLEDDPDLRFALAEVLEAGGHTVHGAGNISQACETLENVAPDLLLLDLMIGSVDTIQVADLAGYRVPDADVIYLTGSNKYPNGELFELSSNASWVLRKPIDFRALMAMVDHVQATHLASEQALATTSWRALSRA